MHKKSNQTVTTSTNIRRIIKVIPNTTIATTKNIQDTPKELIIKNVINIYDLKPNTLAHIKDAKNSNRPNPLHNKPTIQPINTVGIEPTVAAGRKSVITSTRTDNTTTLPPVKKINKEHYNNNHNTPQLHHTITSETPQTHTKKHLTMSTPEQPSTLGPNRRRTQIFKRGGHQS